VPGTVDLPLIFCLLALSVLTSIHHYLSISMAQIHHYLLLYVDDIVLTASSDQLLHRIISTLTTEFCMKDMGPLHHFLGMSVTSHNCTLFLSQRQYMLEILERAGMTNCKPCTTPVDTSAKV
jgi:hypothetical protein